MEIIEIKDMEFYSYHGCFAEEQIVGNKFLVDLLLEITEDNRAKFTDNINDAVNYQTAYDIVKKEMAIKSHLLENVANRILDNLFKNLSGILTAKVKVAKINPPLGGKINNVSVILSKNATDLQ
jgi:dihydroneopterin aldolase